MHRNLVHTFVPEYKVSHRHRARILAWVLEKGCVHIINAQRVPFFGTIHARAAGVNAALKITKICCNTKVSIQPAGQSLFQPFMESFEHNLGQKLNQKAILAHARAHFSP